MSATLSTTTASFSHTLTIPHRHRSVRRIVVLKRELSSRFTSTTCAVVVLSIRDDMAMSERPVGSVGYATESINSRLEAGTSSVREAVEGNCAGINSTTSEGSKGTATESAVPGGALVEEEMFREHRDIVD